MSHSCTAAALQPDKKLPDGAPAPKKGRGGLLLQTTAEVVHSWWMYPLHVCRNNGSDLHMLQVFNPNVFPVRHFSTNVDL